jgi:hypothetical protein
MWELIVVRSKSKGILIAGVLSLSVLAAGCASSSAGGDPGAMAMPAGQSCQSTRAELNKLDAKGIQSKFDACSAKHCSPASQAEVDRYNNLLNQYLGARCHV